MLFSLSIWVRNYKFDRKEGTWYLNNSRHKWLPDSLNNMISKFILKYIDRNTNSKECNFIKNLVITAS